ncbi:hypothetical protein MRBLBA21_002755 [Peribacillus frigoritolerans]
MRRFKGINLASSNQNEREINVHILRKPRRSSLISEIPPFPPTVCQGQLVFWLERWAHEVLMSSPMHFLIRLAFRIVLRTYDNDTVDVLDGGFN